MHILIRPTNINVINTVYTYVNGKTAHLKQQISEELAF